MINHEISGVPPVKQYRNGNYKKETLTKGKLIEDQTAHVIAIPICQKKLLGGHHFPQQHWAKQISANCHRVHAPYNKIYGMVKFHVVFPTVYMSEST